MIYYLSRNDLNYLNYLNGRFLDLCSALGVPESLKSDFIFLFLLTGVLSLSNPLGASVAFGSYLFVVLAGKAYWQALWLDE